MPSKRFLDDCRKTHKNYLFFNDIVSFIYFGLYHKAIKSAAFPGIWPSLVCLLTFTALNKLTWVQDVMKEQIIPSHLRTSNWWMNENEFIYLKRNSMISPKPSASLPPDFYLSCKEFEYISRTCSLNQKIPSLEDSGGLDCNLLWN